MIAIRIQKQKDFMGKLLTSEIFDTFLVNEATIETFNTFHIDGKLHKDFYNSVDSSDYIPDSDFSLWKNLRPICLDLIKGKRTPLGFRFIFYLGGSLREALINASGSDILPEQVNLGLNIKYSSGEMILTTGTAFSIFTLDKEIEKAWDSYIPSFLDKNNIEYELL
ncbi:hypothetical protein SAMN04487928_103109 [Butyrivibrio proteoclasticus]|uniref:Uncharacterized protein n=1 Tax=Butyrivibrio proteoclasticus TaxID=43305 RepID=A0A1I5R4B0_9FIRM|nr:DUF5721 family protein [Butyrivibrio proteoclasticus]SFP53200.1 hypothetical protein SAMN04487928_103109 [Butyrivibrio proteoclasticus]